MHEMQMKEGGGPKVLNSCGCHIRMYYGHLALYAHYLRIAEEGKRLLIDLLVAGNM